MTSPPDDLTILDELPEPYVVIDHDLACTAVNAAFSALLGYAPAALVGKSAEIFWPEIDRSQWRTREISAEFRNTKGEATAVKLALFAGSVLVIRVLASFSGNQVAKVFHAQRLETLGLLAGGVAHDFNNVLTGMLGHLAYLKTVLPGSGPHVESLQAIEEGVVRASSMTQQIVRFARLESSEPSVRMDLVDIVTRVCGLIRGAMPSEVQVRWSPPTMPLPLLASESGVCQVLINLLVNARDAISGNGFIDIEVEHRCPPDEISALFGDEPPSPAYGAVIVTDTGVGMNDDVKARLFEPYFTTKKGAGTGLGLATVNSIVKGLGGAVIVESTPGRGTSFKVVIPVIAEQHDDSPAAEEAGPVPGQGESILVVDDEYAVRNVLGLSLTHLGYRVETAASGIEALEKFADAGFAFDLVILDLLMPGLSGEDVFVRLKRMKSDVKVLLVSGFSSEQVVRRILEQGGRDFIQKPFAIDVLSRKVRGCL